MMADLGKNFCKDTLTFIWNRSYLTSKIKDGVCSKLLQRLCNALCILDNLLTLNRIPFFPFFLPFFLYENNGSMPTVSAEFITVATKCI